MCSIIQEETIAARQLSPRKIHSTLLMLILFHVFYFAPNWINKWFDSKQIIQSLLCAASTNWNVETWLNRGKLTIFIHQSKNVEFEFDKEPGESWVSCVALTLTLSELWDGVVVVVCPRTGGSIFIIRSQIWRVTLCGPEPLNGIWRHCKTGSGIPTNVHLLSWSIFLWISLV